VAQAGVDPDIRVPAGGSVPRGLTSLMTTNPADARPRRIASYSYGP